MSAADMIETQAAEWLAQRDGAGWTDERQQALDAWLNESTAHRVAYLRLAGAWERADRLSVLRRARPEFRPLPRWSMQRLAAGVVLAVAAGSIWWGTRAVLDEGGDRFSTVVGARQVVALADGSQVTLNTDTRLRADVGRGGRAVWLEQGEAYFEVAHDATRPFVVHVAGRRVTVLGTHFSVRRIGSKVQVVVAEGRVGVDPESAPAGTSPTLVDADHVAVADAKSVLVVAREAGKIHNDLSWRQGKLVFEQTTLADAAAEFNRYGRKQLVIADAATAEIRIGGSFDANNADGFATLLRQGFGLVVHDDGKVIRISSL